MLLLSPYASWASLREELRAEARGCVGKRLLVRARGIPWAHEGDTGWWTDLSMLSICCADGVGPGLLVLSAVFRGGIKGGGYGLVGES